MKKLLFVGLTFFMATLVHGQKYETAQGDLANISGIKLYKVEFEYASDLKVPGHSSEKAFLESHSKQLKSKRRESTGNFENSWFENRKAIFEPTFIQEFNAFRLDNRHITVSSNYSEARHSMLIKVELIYPGKEEFFWDKPAELGVTISFLDRESPNVILFETKTVKVHGTTKGDTFDKIATAYGELGRWTAKFLCRKT